MKKLFYIFILLIIFIVGCSNTQIIEGEEALALFTEDYTNFKNEIKNSTAFSYDSSNYILKTHEDEYGSKIYLRNDYLYYELTYSDNQKRIYQEIDGKLFNFYVYNETEAQRKFIEDKNMALEYYPTGLLNLAFNKDNITISYDGQVYTIKTIFKDITSKDSQDFFAKMVRCVTTLTDDIENSEITMKIKFTEGKAHFDFEANAKYSEEEMRNVLQEVEIYVDNSKHEIFDYTKYQLNQAYKIEEVIETSTLDTIVTSNGSNSYYRYYLEPGMYAFRSNYVLLDYLEVTLYDSSLNEIKNSLPVNISHSMVLQQINIETAGIYYFKLYGSFDERHQVKLTKLDYETTYLDEPKELTTSNFTLEGSFDIELLKKTFTKNSLIVIKNLGDPFYLLASNKHNSFDSYYVKDITYIGYRSGEALFYFINQLSLDDKKLNISFEIEVIDDFEDEIILTENYSENLVYGFDGMLTVKAKLVVDKAGIYQIDVLPTEGLIAGFTYKIYDENNNYIDLSITGRFELETGIYYIKFISNGTLFVNGGYVRYSYSES